MVPPSYYQSQQQYGTQTAPAYNRNPGFEDAGYYDANGNFISHSAEPQAYVPPQEPDTHEMNQYPPEKAAYKNPSLSVPEPAYTSPGSAPPPQAGSSSRYGPPSSPPPGHVYDV
jgi:hypothetical protein